MKFRSSAMESRDAAFASTYRGCAPGAIECNCRSRRSTEIPRWLFAKSTFDSRKSRTVYIEATLPTLWRAGVLWRTFVSIPPCPTHPELLLGVVGSIR